MPEQAALREALHDLVADVEPSDGLRRRVVAAQRRRRVPLAAAAVVAVVALVGTAVAVLDDGGPDEDRVTTRPGLEEGWRELAPFPLGPRWYPVTIWTGEEVIVWGGNDVDDRDPSGALPGTNTGARYDPRNDEWRLLPEAPIEPRGDAVGVWTGEELLVWSGHGVWDDESPGAAFDPTTDRWRLLPPAPIAHAVDAAGVWTGTDLVVWGGYDQSADGVEGQPGMVAAGAAYDPAEDTWRALPTAPLPTGRVGHTMTWTGSEVLLWGGTDDDRTGAEHFADGAAYDPADDTWRPISPAPLGGRAAAATAWTGDELLVWGGYVDGIWRENGARYDPVADRWESVDGPVGRAGDSGAVQGIWTGTQLLTWPGVAGYDPVTRIWTTYDEGPLPAGGTGGGTGGAVWAGFELIVLSAVDDRVAAFRPPAATAPEDATLPTSPCGVEADDLAPTYLPDGWHPELRPGEGGGGAGQATAHWAGRPGQSITLWPSPSPWPMAAGTGETIEVLGRPARLGDVHEGYAVETGCGFDLVAYGITKDDLRLFAEGLVDAPSGPGR